ncbi:MAG TPA: hypothetical protein VGN14_09955 [Candidatus Elarobacter sp.]
MRKQLAIAAAAALIPLAALAAPQIPPKVSVTMPPDPYAFKAGPGSAAAMGNCLTCHSAAYVVTQPPLDRARWDAEVTKMRKAYGAPVSDADQETIVDYLTATYGPKQP